MLDFHSVVYEDPRLIKLSPRRRILLEKLVFSQLPKKSTPAHFMVTKV
jgi:hypothetical protein